MEFFELKHKDTASHARAGVITTDHGTIPTPIFMPVGTQATVKTLDSSDVEQLGASIILGNTYHLHLRPGEDTVAAAGGLHRFMGWNKPILTDSGGFQVFSLGLKKDARNTKGEKNPYNETSPYPPLVGRGGGGIAAPLSKKEGVQGEISPTQGRLVEIDEDGVTFRSYIDGSTHRFTPEVAIEIQHKLGADIIMAFDECTPDTADYAYTKAAMERTHRWAERCLQAHRNPLLTKEGRPSQAGGGLPSFAAQHSSALGSPHARQTPPNLPLVRGGNDRYRQFLFGIIQGAQHKELREESARFISSLDFDGVAIGGESIGYNMKATADILDWVYPLIPENKPHYAMGVGLSPADLIIAIDHGVDMFDCVAPTRLARHGMLFNHDRAEGYRLNIKNAQFARDQSPLDDLCACSTCQKYTRSYLHHLFAATEVTGQRLATIHNLYFLINLMREAREAILDDCWSEFKKQWVPSLL